MGALLCQCTSVLLDAYVPVLIIGFCVQLLMPIIVIKTLRGNSFKFIPEFIRSQLNGVLWPEYWCNLTDTIPIEPFHLMKIANIMSREVFYPVAVMMTFGICSPPLAVLVAIAVMTKCGLWVWAMNHFIANVNDRSESIRQRCLSALSELQFPQHMILRRVFWITLGFSMIFILFLYWDTTDEVSWEAALGLAVFVLVLWGVSYIKSYSMLSTANMNVKSEFEVGVVVRSCS